MKTSILKKELDENPEKQFCLLAKSKFDNKAVSTKVKEIKYFNKNKKKNKILLLKRLKEIKFFNFLIL